MLTTGRFALSVAYVVGLLAADSVAAQDGLAGCEIFVHSAAYDSTDDVLITSLDHLRDLLSDSHRDARFECDGEAYVGFVSRVLVDRNNRNSTDISWVESTVTSFLFPYSITDLQGRVGARPEHRAYLCTKEPMTLPQTGQLECPDDLKILLQENRRLPDLVIAGYLLSIDSSNDRIGIYIQKEDAAPFPETSFDSILVLAVGILVDLTEGRGGT